jgi:hypothetical protein
MFALGSSPRRVARLRPLWFARLGSNQPVPWDRRCRRPIPSDRPAQPEPSVSGGLVNRGPRAVARTIRRSSAGPPLFEPPPAPPTRPRRHDVSQTPWLGQCTAAGDYATDALCLIARPSLSTELLPRNGCRDVIRDVMEGLSSFRVCLYHANLICQRAGVSGGVASAADGRLLASAVECWRFAVLLSLCGRGRLENLNLSCHSRTRAC